MMLNIGYWSKENLGFDADDGFPVSSSQFPVIDKKDDLAMMQQIIKHDKDSRHFEIRKEAIKIILAQAALRRRLNSIKLLSKTERK